MIEKIRKNLQENFYVNRKPAKKKKKLNIKKTTDLL